jgi:hypothetical protein
MENDNKTVGIASALLVVVLGGVIYYYKYVTPAPEAVAPAAPPPVAAAPVAPSAEPLPKLEQSDEFMRSGAASLSADPVFAAWLKTDDLLSRFTAAVNMIGKGRIPKDALSFMAPRRKFKVREKGGQFFADPNGYGRYDAAAAAIGSLDAAAAARLFQRCKPLFQEAYQALGERNGDVRDAVVRAAQELLKAPVVESGTPLKEKGLVYAYVDDSLESLSPAQKQLMRMGPKNQAAIQSKLRAFVQALDASGPPQ